MYEPGAGGSSLLIDGFLQHDVTPASITAQAEAVAAPAGDIENFDADLTALHNTARTGVAGVLADAMDGADLPTKRQGVELVQGIVVGAAAIRLLGFAVEAFNGTIDNLNAQIRAEATRTEQVQKKSALSGHHAIAVETLHAAARAAMKQLGDPLDPDQVRALYTAGALPSYTPAIFSNLDIDFPALQPVRLPYDLAAMTPDELEKYLQDHPDAAVTVMEFRLREEGLLDGPVDAGLYRSWLENAADRGVSVDTVVDIARRFELDSDDFDVLDDLEEVTDPDEKSYFLLPSGISGDDARKAVLMTYILNAGTDYGSASPDNDFPEAPYSADEIQRIIDRQGDNDWTYDEDVSFVNGNGGRLATTPNGMLMGLGGNWLQDKYSLKGGTTWGDTFMLNVDGVDGDDAEQVLRDTVAGGLAVYESDDGSVGPDSGRLDLDRLLHHEERHSQQWAREGYTHFIASYAWEQLTGGNGTEEDAGLSDGGYR